MTRDKDEPEKIVADVIVDRRFELGYGSLLLRLQIAGDLLVLPLEKLVAPHHVDRAALRGSHQPCPGIVRHARLRPLVERREQRVLGKVFRESDVAHDSREPGDEPSGLYSPDRVDCAVSIGSRHRYQSHQLYPRGQG